MTDDTNNNPMSETQPVRPAGETAIDGSPPSPTPATEPAHPTRRGVRERLSGAGSRSTGAGVLVASTVAALVIGGLGGAAIQAALDDDHRPGHRDDRGNFFRGEHPRGPIPGPPGRPQLPPISPEGQDAPPTPSEPPTS